MKTKYFDSTMGKQIIGTKQRGQEQTHLHIYRCMICESYHSLHGSEEMICSMKMALGQLNIQARNKK